MKLLIFVPLLFVISSCVNHHNKIESREEKNGDKAFKLSPEDEEMNRARQQAQSSYTDFLKIFSKKDQDTTVSHFVVKQSFGYDENSHEHMWIGNLFFKEGSLMGELHSEPIHVTGLTYGDTIRIVKDSVSDWMYVKGGRLVGGYTIKVLYDRMTPEEQRETEIGIGAKIK